MLLGWIARFNLALDLTIIAIILLALAALSFAG
jgi:hypothetical protein